MKTISIDSSQPNLEGILREAADGEVVFLTTDGVRRFAIVPIDESDQEVFALRSNSEFMAYLDECARRAMREPTKSLEEIKKLYWTEEFAPESSLDEERIPKGPFHEATHGSCLDDPVRRNVAGRFHDIF